MLIFDNIKLVYLANPKTGTTSFERAFEQYANREQSRLLPKHIPFRRFQKEFSKLAREYESVTCVRDPLETLFSWYRYRSRPMLYGDGNSTHAMSFEEFFVEWCKDEPKSFADVSGSVGFILSHGGRIAPRLKVFQYGVRPGLQEYVAAKLGAVVPELEKNVSPPSKTRQGIPLVDRVDTSHKKLQSAYEIYQNITFASS